MNKIDDELKEFYEPETETNKVNGTIEKVNKKMGDTVNGVKAAGRWIINILAIVAIIVISLVEASWDFVAQWKSLLLNALLISLINYIVYLNSGGIGAEQGMKDKNYISVMYEYIGIKKRIIEKGIRNRLPDWCTEWSRTNLENDRKQLLADSDISYEEYKEKQYAQYGFWELRKLGLRKKALMIIREANRMKPIKLTPSMLIDNYEKIKRPKSALGISPQVKGFGEDAVKLIYMIFSFCFTVSITFKMYDKFGWETVASTVISILLLCYNIVSGYTRRFNRVIIKTVSYTKDRTQYLEEFEQWCEQKGE